MGPGPSWTPCLQTRSQQVRLYSQHCSIFLRFDGSIARHTPAVREGGRDRIYTLMYSSNYLASAIGPLLAALLFYLRGNSWSLHTLGAVVLIGMAVAVIPICTIFMFNDDNSLDSETAPIMQSLLSEKDRGALTGSI